MVARHFLCCLPLRLGALLISACQLVLVGLLAAASWYTVNGLRTFAKESLLCSETDGGDVFFCPGQADVFRGACEALSSPMRCITPSFPSLPSLGESYAITQAASCANKKHSVSLGRSGARPACSQLTRIISVILLACKSSSMPSTFMPSSIIPAKHSSRTASTAQPTRRLRKFATRRSTLESIPCSPV